MKISKSNIFVFVLLISVLIYFFLKGEKREQKLLENYKFTVGEISSEWHSKTTFKSFGIDYFYNLNKQKYEGIAKKKDLVIGEKYLVIYDSVELKFGKLLPMYPLPDSIEPPPNGWRLDEVPIEVDWKKIEKYILNR